MAYRSRRDADYAIVGNRRLRRNGHYPPDDYLDDDDESLILGPEGSRRYPRIRPYRDHQSKYLPNDDIDYDYRRSRIIDPIDQRVPIRRGRHAERIVYDADEDEDALRLLRHRRTPSPLDYRRSRYHSYDSHPLYYEDADGQLITRPMRRDTFHSRKTQVVYADDEPSKVIKKVIIDPRTGHRETIFEKDRARRHHKYIVRQHPADLIYDSDDEDYYDPYARGLRHRTVPRHSRSHYDPAKEYLKIRHTAHSDPVYSVTTKLPALKNGRSVVYGVPSRKAISSYAY